MNREEFSNLLVNSRENRQCSKTEMCHKMQFLSYRPLIRIERAMHSYGMNTVFQYLSVLGYILTINNGKKKPISLNEQQDISDWFEKEYKKNKLTQRGMAELIGVSKGFVQNICLNKCEIGIDKFLQIIEKLGYTISIKESDGTMRKSK